MTAPPGHTWEVERWLNRPKAANSAPQDISKADIRLVSTQERHIPPARSQSPRGREGARALTSGFRHHVQQLMHCAVRGICQERQDETAVWQLYVRTSTSSTSLTRATRLVEEEGGGQAVRFVFMPDKKGAVEGGQPRASSEGTLERQLEQLKSQLLELPATAHTRVRPHRTRERGGACSSALPGALNSAAPRQVIVQWARDAQRAARSKCDSVPTAAVEHGEAQRSGSPAWAAKVQHIEPLAETSFGEATTTMHQDRTYLSFLVVFLNVGKEIDFLGNTGPQNRLNQ
ncbi:hypothetical protein EDB84DRAFT_1435080 [Lactarius hengduanensis]|nr:hypothetical protein EDB84DRAFT_1435080 [Lactarius hengduanensis]